LLLLAALGRFLGIDAVEKIVRGDLLLAGEQTRVVAQEGDEGGEGALALHGALLDFAGSACSRQAGSKMSRTGHAMLQSMAAGAGGDGPPFIRNFVKLAVALSAIDGWKKFQEAAKPAANGLHDVAQWRECVAR